MNKELIKHAYQLGYAHGINDLVKQAEKTPETQTSDLDTKLRKRRERLIRIIAALAGAGLGASSSKSSGGGALPGALLGGALGYGGGWAANGLMRYAGLDPLVKTVRVENARSPVDKASRE